MPDIERLTFSGDIGLIYRDDGSVVKMTPSVNNQWIPMNGRQYPIPPGSSGGPTILVTAAMIEAAVTSVGANVGDMIDTSANIADAFNNAVADSYPNILSSKNRVACLIGECAQETDWYKTTTEYGIGSDPPYVGRGFIQLTHASNYAGFGRWMKSLGLLTDDNYFVDNPTALSDLKWAAYTAIYYFTQPKWDSKSLFEFCDTSSTPWHDISRAINRGDPSSTSAAYGEADRATAIDAVLAITPDPTGPVVPTGVGDAVAAWMVDHVGDFRYSQQSPQRRDPVTYGQTDCSALIAYVYQLLGKIHTGWWTGSHDDGMQQYGTIIESGTGTPNEAGMQVGDCVFFNWDGPSADYDHVDLYIGSDQVCGHGGPGMGPTVKTLSTRCSAAYNWRIRRYV